MIKENIAKVKDEISAACLRCGRKSEEITLVAITKTHSAEVVRKAVEAGIKDIGENRVQEAQQKYSELSAIDRGLPIFFWHLVGHLQTNKVKPAVKIFNLIQSVDSIRLALEIEKEAEKINKIQDCLIEIKTSPEETKSGIQEEDIYKLIEGIKNLKHVRVKGLMTIAPYGIDSRPYFKKLYSLKEKLSAERYSDNISFNILSMGMSDDFETALEEGSNMVRIGRAIFGQRP